MRRFYGLTAAQAAWWAERAAIQQYDGGLHKRDAELAAYWQARVMVVQPFYTPLPSGPKQLRLEGV